MVDASHEGGSVKPGDIWKNAVGRQVPSPDERQERAQTGGIMTINPKALLADPEVLANNQALRLECLKLAVAEVAMDAEDTVQRARAYADFVISGGGERDA